MESLDELLDDFVNDQIVVKTLKDGQTIKLKLNGKTDSVLLARVFTKYGNVPDGIYTLSSNMTRYEIKNKTIIASFYIEFYKQRDGRILEVDGSTYSGVGKGSRAWMDNQIAPDGVYKTGLFSKLKIMNGRVI